MVGGNPGLVVGLSTAGDSRAVSTNDSNLVSGVDLLRATRGLLSALTALAASFLLGKEGGDPSVVDEVDGSSKDTSEDEIEEDAANHMSLCQ